MLIMALNFCSFSAPLFLKRCSRYSSCDMRFVVDMLTNSVEVHQQVMLVVVI